VSVCPSASMHPEVHARFSPNFVHVTYGRAWFSTGGVAICDISGFMDDIILHVMGHAWKHVVTAAASDVIASSSAG